MQHTIGSRPGVAALPAVLLGLALGACGSESPLPVLPVPASPAPATATGATVPLPIAADERSLLDAVYRIDVEVVEAVIDVFPAEQRVQVWSATTFRMRPGQSRPIVHFQPVLSGSEVALALNGEGLDPRREADVRILRYDTSAQDSVELQRDLAAGVSHRLEASHTLPLSDGFRRFFSDVNDFEGHGNERLFPTLNVPHELARHILVFRVHSSPPYRFVGSGLVTSGQGSGVQEWRLDTERAVASYTVMFFLAPASDVVVEERRVDRVDVRVLSSLGGASVEEAYGQLETWLPELRTTLGPFPMPRGISIALTERGGGMEYYGGTITSLRALRHEVFHMYYGCSTIAMTYRDSWWDEAINMWYELSADPTFPPIFPEFRSGIVGNRTPVTVGFDRRAYDEGARIIQAVAMEMGGRGRAVEFFSQLHQRRRFDPFTTVDLANEILAFSGADFHERFGRWLYNETGVTAEATTGAYDWLHRVDLTPSETVRRRYGR
jgi:hypothetical protein